MISIFNQYIVLNSAYVSTYSFLHIGYTLEAGLLTGSEIYLTFFFCSFVCAIGRYREQDQECEKEKEGDKQGAEGRVEQSRCNL